MAASVTEQSVMGVIRAARPSFRNSHDKVVFAVHASFLASGFVLHATGPPAFTDDVLSSASTEEVGIEHWNEFDDSYAFVYSKPETGSKKILVKCLAMNEKLLIDALKGDSDQLVHLEIDVGDYVAGNGGNNNNNYTTMFKDFGKLVRDVDNEIVGKFSGSSTASSSSQRPSSESRGALRDDSEQPHPGVSEPYDPYNIRPPPQGYIVPPIYDADGDDLFPGPGAGVYPTRGDYGRPGSMLIGPNDPRFFGGIGRGPNLPGGLQPGVPPGARFDPYGPPGVPGFEPNRFFRNPRGPGGGTHPDLEHFGDGSDFI